MSIFDHPYVPGHFLGGCRCEYLSQSAQETSNAWHQTYYMIQLAYHIHSLLEPFEGVSHRSDVAEMSLHYVVTISAMLFS
jgi:TLC domain